MIHSLVNQCGQKNANNLVSPTFPPVRVGRVPERNVEGNLLQQLPYSRTYQPISVGWEVIRWCTTTTHARHPQTSHKVYIPYCNSTNPATPPHPSNNVLTLYQQINDGFRAVPVVQQAAVLGRIGRDGRAKNQAKIITQQCELKRAKG